MFKVKFKDAKFVRGIFEAISAIITETRLKVDPQNGLSMTAMDGSHICLVDLNLKKEDMDEFSAKENYELGINLDDLVKIIKRGSSNDEITFLHDPKDKKLVIEMKAENAKKARKFTMALIDIDVEEIDVNQLDQLPFDNKCQFKVGILDEAIKDAEIFSEVLQIKAKDVLQFSAEGTMGDMEYVVEKEELISQEFGGSSEGSFAIQFLKNVLKISSITDQVSMALKSESPVKMKFSILNNSFIQYFLAPRVEEDSDSMYEED
jgi:proliferating cell nuclear antigen